MHKLVFIALLAATATACSVRSERVVQPAPTTTTTQRTTTVSPDPTAPPVTTTTTTTTPVR